ncbi:DUF2336 domain-containing protein [Bradyrhizobium sp.]|uniref:DUF2336 domain-containing protein n=1 Tax=Bradyrhizobium sp. TaxID=376 RepID=UPI002607665B|nr:DUF2336 domain-containing protein [Bradyrhizobium sp.]
MTKPPLFSGFDGLMNLSRREGVDIRPTLLRVLADLYVQTSTHSEEEARQFVELTSRLIDQVDDATRAAVRARLALYPATPAPILNHLGLKPSHPEPRKPLAREIHASSSAAQEPAATSREPHLRMTSNLSMQPADAAEISGLFFGAGSAERAVILHNLSETPLKPSPRVPASRAKRAIEALEMAAWIADLENFTLELSETLILPWKIATQVVNDPTGEPLACAAKALGMPGVVYQRVLLFLKPEIGSSVHMVYRLSRLYDTLQERSALIMLAAWRGSTLVVTRAKYRPTLYDDERGRARSAAAQTRTASQPASDAATPRAGSSQKAER